METDSRTSDDIAGPCPTSLFSCTVFRIITLQLLMEKHMGFAFSFADILKIAYELHI